MIYNKNNLIIAGACGESHRAELSGVLFKKDRTIATDSTVLVQVENPTDMAELVKELPELPDKSKPLINFAKTGYIIPKKSVLKVLSNLKNETGVMTILRNCWFLQPKQIGSSVIATTDLDKTDLVMTRPIEGQYPDVSQLLKPATAKMKVLINLDKLKQVIDILDKMNLGKNPAVEISIEEAEKPVRMTAKTLEGQNIVALVMPLKR